VPKQYLGHLSSRDPLHPYLVRDVLPQIGVNSGAAEFRVFSMKDGKVYLYEERHSSAQIVGKFFMSEGNHSANAVQRMDQEFDNLRLLRAYGLAGYPHHVVRPLGTNAWLNSILVEEYAKGVPLSSFVNHAIHNGRSQPLFEKLTALAYFLATLHNRTANGQGVDFHQDCAYLDRLVRKLQAKQVIGAWDANEFSWLRDRWREKPRMWEDNQVLVHGDATPSNLLFGRGLSVIAIDLERMKRADRTFDLGRIAGELQHYFLQATGNKHRRALHRALSLGICLPLPRPRPRIPLHHRPVAFPDGPHTPAHRAKLLGQLSPTLAAGARSQNHLADAVMEIRALLFDVNGTLIDIETDEWMEEVYRAIAHFLTYQGISLHRGEVRDLYFQIMKEQFAASSETYPEFDVVAVWREVLRRYATDYTRSLAPEKLRRCLCSWPKCSAGLAASGWWHFLKRRRF
jgi:aminoglycoside phosphotransferase